MTNNRSETLILVSLRIVISAVFIAIAAAILYGCVAVYQYGASWRSEVQSKAYSIQVINNAKADREAQLIKDGQLPFQMIPYDAYSQSGAEPSEDLN